MSGTIVVDRIESDASYASSINIASPIQISNTITGNVNFDSGTLFVDAVNNRVGVGGITNPSDPLHVVKSSGTTIGRFQHTTTNGGNIAIQTPSYEIAFGIDSSGGAYVNTGSANRFLVDAAGRVTTPYQPLFSVRRASSGTTTVSGGANQLILTDVDINVGSCYNTSTGRFTAPTSGYYYFNFAAYYSASGALSYVGSVIVRQDGRAYYGFQIGASDAVPCVTAITYLNTNDYVYVSTYPSGSATLQHVHTWFSGYLIG